MVLLFLLLGCNLSYIVDLLAALHELASASARTLRAYITRVHYSHQFDAGQSNIRLYYPTAPRRVQITPKTSTNITRYLYSRGPVRQVCLLLANQLVGFPAAIPFRYVYFCHAFPVHKYPRNKPRSIYQYSNMAPRLSGLTSIFGVVFFVSILSLFWELRDKRNLKNLQF